MQVPAAAAPQSRQGADANRRNVLITLRREWPAWLLGLCVGLAYFLSSPVQGDFWWFDASRHAMNSVFVHDFFAQGGWKDPLRFAKAYYDQYPGINIGFYPPFLYLATAPLLGLFGVSHAVCQAVVSGFAALCAMAGYAWTRPALGRLGACAAGVMLVAVPEMALWGRQVQLDVPAVALLLWGVWALAKWLALPQDRWLWLSALLLGCAMLTRVQTLFAWPLWLAAVLLHPAARAQRWRLRIGATALYAVLSLPSIAAALYFAKVMGSLAGQMPDMPDRWSWANWGWYAARMPDQLGVVGMAVLLLGLLLLIGQGARAAMRRGAEGSPERPHEGSIGRSLEQPFEPPAKTVWLALAMTLSMAVLAWLFFSLVSNKEPRFSLPVLPFALLAALLVIARQPLGGRRGEARPTGPTQSAGRPAPVGRPAFAWQTALEWPPAPAWPSVLVVVLALGMGAEAWMTQRGTDVPRVTGHRAAALLAAQLAAPDSRVMISAHRDGNFIFALRAWGQRPDLAVRRADKLLVDMTIMRQLGIRDRGLDEDDIRRLLDRERVSVVVAQTGYLGDQPSMQALERLLDSGCCFQLSQTLPIEGQHRADETALRVYVRSQRVGPSAPPAPLTSSALSTSSAAASSASSRSP